MTRSQCNRAPYYIKPVAGLFRNHDDTEMKSLRWMAARAARHRFGRQREPGIDRPLWMITSITV